MTAMSVTRDGQAVRAHVVEIKLVLGQPDDVITDLLVLGECLSCHSVGVLDSVLPARQTTQLCVQAYWIYAECPSRG